MTGRGKLRTYLGIAPGVGKTYAMLRDARERRRAGVELFATLALAVSLLVAATAVSIGMARAQALHAVIVRL